MDVAVVTYAGLPQLDAYDAPLLPALAAQGLEARICLWDDPAIDWSVPKVVLIRTTWDSHLRREAFVAWASKVGRLTRLYNPPEVLRWNTHKSYLRELEAKGVPCTPTVWVPRGGTVSLETVARERGWEALVLKPVVSAGALKTYRFARAELPQAQARLEALAAESEVMVQPYLTAFETEGERAYLFFDGAFSHSVRRPPGLADSPRAFAKPHLLEPLPEELQLCEQVLSSVGQPLLYARVDVATDNEGRTRLQELEATEPSLFLSLDPAAATRLAEAIRRKL
ncbi:ATP-grasp domain-containing protein [Hyalangium rubrum]|uniref:ATP-grasp domain-containing protein n=1 Tax=Hyalangium rubrum TaxID=3103134 RepID=A0ABU5HFE7_9BACT|nr:hypothetical protein [Hyalangium sp. s54d21]MDY7232190.1 hypothetical protein [Hyalangium sp. s54d21]